MDLKQIEYIVKIDDEHSITPRGRKAVRNPVRLKPAASAAGEGAWGTAFFHRSKIDMRPTEIGQVYLDNARKSCGLSSAPTTSSTT